MKQICVYFCAYFWGTKSIEKVAYILISFLPSSLVLLACQRTKEIVVTQAKLPSLVILSVSKISRNHKR